MDIQQKKRSIASLKKIIKTFGSQIKLAQKLNISPQAITGWLHRGVPANRVIELEKLNKDNFNRSDLRPDLYPEE